MIVYYLFVHKKSVWKRKVFIIFIKNKKFNKTQKKKKITYLVGFFRWVFWGFFGWVFLGGFFNANPDLVSFFQVLRLQIPSVLRMRIRIRIRRIHMIWGLPAMDPLVRDTDPDPDLSIIKQNLDSYCFVTSVWLFIFEKLYICTFKK